MPYLYPKPKTERLDVPLNRIPPTPAGEGLTGQVMGKDASDIEERYARALFKQGVEFQFQYDVWTAYTLPTEQKKVDFVVWDGGVPFPEEVDAAFTHNTAEQKAYDVERDGIVNDAMASEGWQPIRRIDGERMNTQEGADQVAMEMHG